MLLDVVEVRAREAYRLWLRFENGEEREFDCMLLLDKKPYKKLADKRFFKQARVALGTVSWPGEIDIAPETLYLDSKPVDKAAA